MPPSGETRVRCQQWRGWGAFYLDDGEVAVMGSEDIKCFYYLFRIPDSWQPFMGFAREVPPHLCPREWQGGPCHLVSRVLPMGFLNSVGLAQHIHRNVVNGAGLVVVPWVEVSKSYGGTVSPLSPRIFSGLFGQLG